jgi:hypothetical protein
MVEIELPDGPTAVDVWPALALGALALGAAL